MADIAGNTSTTASIGVGTNTTSAIDTLGDHDWYKVTLTAGQTITVTVTGAGNLDTYLNLYDPTGTTILASNDDIVAGDNTNSRITFTASTGGTYYVDVGAWHDQSTGAYDLFVEPSPPPTWTYDQIAYQLTNGYWGSDVHHFNVTQGGTITVNISALTAAEQTLARAALQDWTDVIGVHFQEVSSGGQIQFSDKEDPSSPGPIAQTDAQWSNGIISSANVQISTSWVTQYGTGLNTYSFQTYIHEIGHALGLGHAGEYNGNATYSTDALFANDAWSTTVMSYFSPTENTYFSGQGFTRNFLMTPMDGDVVAMQSLYGLSSTTRTGNTTYGFNTNSDNPVYNASLYPHAAYTIYDSGGIDTLDYSGFSASQLINLTPETFSNVGGSTGNVTIARGVVIENAIGGSGNDTIIGNSVANVLTGGLGSDTLTGGGGADVFKDTEAGHNHDTITDFQPGDGIIFTDASLGGFSFSLSGSTLTYTGGSMIVQGTLPSAFTASTAPGGGVELSYNGATHHLVPEDFNGDGVSDLMFRDASGTLSEWLGQGSGTFAWNQNASFQLSADWAILGFGDFNGDGKSDVLWRQSSTGAFAIWDGKADGSFVSAVNYNLPSTYTFAGIGDFNGDGKSDILWRDSLGTLSEWLGQANGTFAWNSKAAFQIGTDWQLAGTGDFNGDGRDDLLWRNSSSGQITEWLGQSDGTFAWNANFNLSTNFHLAGTGDFNGDGIADLMWRDASGNLSEWLGQSNGSFAWNPNAIYSMSNDWELAGSGDYNHDGIDDLLWRSDSTGRVIEWLGHSDGTFSTNPSAQYDVGTNFHIQPPSDHFL